MTSLELREKGYQILGFSRYLDLLQLTELETWFLGHLRSHSGRV